MSLFCIKQCAPRAFGIYSQLYRITPKAVSQLSAGNNLRKWRYTLGECFRRELALLPSLRPYTNFRCSNRIKTELHQNASRTMAASSTASGSGHLSESPGFGEVTISLQHASNPVHWYPWGDEAIQKAKAENKPIFLSVGYSTCHWCHVMERESFENPEIGEVLNKSFVSIKVDREERPDVDRVYMNFVQATTGQGGWPMSVWLTPDLKPIFGGTYFPPDDRYYGRPGFKTLLMLIADKWKSSQTEIEQQGTAILDALMRGTHVAEHGEEAMPSLQVINELHSTLEKSYDEEYGGFNKAPKFPQPVNFNALFRLYYIEKDTERGKSALNMCLHTLRMMAKGGMHDHIAQGFHRYSTDREWHVPHFEKMLYDQGQLAVSYLDAYQITKDQVFAEVARDIFEYVNRDLSHPEGGFYSAEDADSLPAVDSKEKKEGAFCVWSWEELHSLLEGEMNGEEGPSLAELFCFHCGCQKEGNVDPLQDPHEELKGQNVLMVKGSVEQTAHHFGLQSEVVNAALQKCRQTLFERRLQRPKPHLDNKMISAWNGLMISGLARGGQVLGDPALTERAVKAAHFLQTHVYRSEDNTLLRSCYTGLDGGVTQVSQPIDGFVEDYAFVIRGLLDLYEASLDARWLEWCQKLQAKQDELFWDVEGGGYFSSQDQDPSVVLRLKEFQDGAEPSPNSVSCMNLLRLASYLDQAELRQKAERILRLFARHLTSMPHAVPELVCGLMFVLQSPKQIIIVGSLDSGDTKAMLRAVHNRFLPNKILILVNETDQGFLHEKVETLKSLRMLDGKATAYVCENFTCSAPTNSVEVLEQQLDCGD
ncbi:spermatogenesis-associated protein 20-like [Babylonia areolata]|uniref:spermatogenesis-associated protein 20-like n=1 Tax=Babylonia areolata TaxID=304850 RepID=UPI003FD4AA79